MVPILYLHGIRLSAAAWTAHLSDGGASHAIDLPGHGAHLDGLFTMPAAVEAVSSAITALGGRAMVVGHSLGGYVAMATAAAHPDQVAGLVIAGSTAVPSRAATAPFLVMHKLLTSLPDGGATISRRIFRAVLPEPVATAVTSAPIATTAIPAVVGALRSFDPLAALSAYSGPVTFVNGTRDHLRMHEKRFLVAARDSHLVLVPGAGHYLPMTHPAEFARHVRTAAMTVREEVPQ